MRSIFINYRRSDSEGESGRLFDELTLRFSDVSVFMDVAAIEPGRDFRKAIDQSVATCTVLLAVMGQDWLEWKDALGHRRLEDANDFVRIELASALRRDIPVVPVLVRGAKMPRVDQLPDDLKELAYRNAVELTHARWKSDVHVLVEALRPLLGSSGDASAAPSTPGEKEVSRTVTDGSGNSSTSGAPVATPATPSIDPQTLEQVSRELATYIGPIAEVVVKRAAKRCSSEEELCAMVAQEIKSAADRANFLRSCRR